ncbi:MAG: hypothetical protein HYX63_14360 [Gammaproteobacteria bacterium]|nr:hypothetical protein [Gammaproteobacteria bacterium]
MIIRVADRKLGYYYTPTLNNRLKEIRLGSVMGTVDASFIFDHEGRLTSQSGSTGRTLPWDAKSRLQTLTQGGATETYRYDVQDHRKRNTDQPPEIHRTGVRRYGSLPMRSITSHSQVIMARPYDPEP